MLRIRRRAVGWDGLGVVACDLLRRFSMAVMSLAREIELLICFRMDPARQRNMNKNKICVCVCVSHPRTVHGRRLSLLVCSKANARFSTLTAEQVSCFIHSHLILPHAPCSLFFYVCVYASATDLNNEFTDCS